MRGTRKIDDFRRRLSIASAGEKEKERVSKVIAETTLVGPQEKKEVLVEWGWLKLATVSENIRLKAGRNKNRKNVRAFQKGCGRNLRLEEKRSKEPQAVGVRDQRRTLRS